MTMQLEKPLSLEPVNRWISRYGVDILRVSLGLVFLVFGVLKFFPGVSPAQELSIRTVETLTFGIVNGASRSW